MKAPSSLNISLAVIVLVAIAAIFWEGVAPDPLAQINNNEKELDRHLPLVRRRSELLRALMQDLIGDRISFDDATAEFHRLVTSTPPMIDSIMASEKVDVPMEACRRAILSGVKESLRNDPEKCRQVLERLNAKRAQ